MSPSTVIEGKDREALLEALVDQIPGSPPPVERVKQMCSSCGGLVSNKFRKDLWPLIIDSEVEREAAIESYRVPSKEEIEKHKDYTQVFVDVSRSLKRFPPSIQTQDSVVDRYMDDLIQVILKILDTDPDLYYYQGFHDILVTFLMVLGREVTYEVLKKLVHSHLKPFMARTMHETNEMLYLMYPIFEKEDRVLFDFLMKAELGTIFALPWVITWFSHNLLDLDLVLRLFDLFIASDHHLPLYLSAAIVLHLKSEVCKLECEMSEVHQFLSRSINDDAMPWEQLICSALKLYAKYPPASLMKRAKLIQEISLPKPARHRPESVPVMQTKWRYVEVVNFAISWMKHRPLLTAALLSGILLAYFVNSRIKPD